ncbi:Lin1244/Lin1753 domain-containing protein [Sphingobacterium thalpophilum]|uniref:Lin1244/Lin1753 domain-containing protein n=1 Tax=Sphingobacterium thalpophilum TaxID=259 RepID=UPI003D976E14
MAGRKKKNTVDYFPHYIGEGRKIQFIEAKYGNDGYATWFKILESLATTPNHFINLNDEMELVFLATKCKVTKAVLISILNDLAMLGSINKILWDRQIIWSETFVDSIKDAYKKRATFSLTFDELFNHLFGAENVEKIISDSEIQSNPISDTEIDKSDAEIYISDGINGERRNKKEEIGNKKEEIYSGLENPGQKLNEYEEDEENPKAPWEQYVYGDIETPRKDILNDKEFISRLASANVISEEEAKRWIDNFFQSIEFSQEYHSNLQGYRKHCSNYIGYKLKNQQKNYNNGTQNQRPGQRTSGRAPQGGYRPL